MPDNYLTDADISFIDDMLEKYGEEDSIGNFSELDGFLTALVSGPEMIMPSQWMPWIWGDEQDQPTWETDAEATQFFELLLRAMNDTATKLMEAPSDFQPMFENLSTKTHEQWFMATWCLGYLRAVFIGDWPEIPEEFSHWLALIEQQSFEEQADNLLAEGLDAQIDMASELTLAALMLHRFWLEQRLPAPSPQINPSQPLRSGPKVGRNDPCPCGSGKKFKQCCLH
ncbi:UPF0149 family protein [Simiduia litorea]|uniref:UPF0149 family protein n=1 Tax=Simiduia litorea TaxID=1435348 RepID=UPI0036F29DA3